MRAHLVLCWAIFVLDAAVASTITIECPAKFPADAIRFGNTPPGWTPFAPSALEVHTAELMYGPPASHAYAAPTTYHEGKRRDVGVWGASSTYQNWLQCGYGAGSEVTLARQLPASVSDCTITKDKDSRGNVERVFAVCTITAAPRELD